MQNSKFRKRRRCVFRPLAVVATAFLASGLSENHAGKVAIDDFFDPDKGIYFRGEYSQIGTHPIVPTIMFVGQSGNQFNEIYNSFVVFDLAPASSLLVESAVLRLELESYFGSNSSESISIHEVTTSISRLMRSWTQSPDALPIYADLADTAGGVPFGTTVIEAAALSGSILEITLSELAVAAINNAGGGLFALGIHLDSISSPAGTQEGVRFAKGSEERGHQLVLTGVHVPDGGSTLGLFSLASLGCLAMASRRLTS